MLSCLLIVVCTPTAALAQSHPQCLDQPGGTVYECVYRPQVVEPWRYSIPGPIQGTQYSLTEGQTLAEYAGLLAAACQDCCEAGTLILISPTWVDWIDGYTWNSSWPSRADKSLTYRVKPRNADGTCAAPWFINTNLVRERTLSCELPWAKDWRPDNTAFCRRFKRNQECRIGDSISLPSATQVLTETDYRSPQPEGLAFERDFRADGINYPTSDDNLWLGVGQSWTHNYAGAAYVLPTQIWVQWGRAPVQYFDRPAGQPAFPIELASRRRAQQVRLFQLSDSRFAHTTASNQFVTFDVIQGLSGDRAVATSVSSLAGWTVTLTPSTAGPLRAEEPGGRALQFQYGVGGDLSTVIDPAGGQIQFAYKLPPSIGGSVSPGREYRNLERITFQDAKIRQYTYPNWSINGPERELATRVTSVVDELGVQYKTIAYDAGGYVASTERAGGVSRHSIQYGQVIDPLGTSWSFSFTEDQNPWYVWQPAGAGCGASTSVINYDSATGNPVSKDDFNGNRVCYAHDASGRNLEVTRVEGLGFDACSNVTPPNVALPTGSRKISSQWHPDWRLVTKLAEPGRRVTSVYNGQPDPFNGNAIASCAPSGALLPDGKPIAVMCKQVEQATTDANGSLGFTAALQAGVANRTRQWTYNQYGQVLTAKDPLNNTTTYAYYVDTVFTGTDPNAVGHRIGDLQTMTNALGRVTNYTLYDKHGQLLQMTDPNGVITTHTYDLRQRHLSTTVGGQTTSYTYDAAGQLLKVTAPDASWIGYEYDPAHRLTATKDNLGNRIEYTLDNAGNRTAENVKDLGGTLRRQLSRSTDPLGRVQQTTGRLQ